MALPPQYRGSLGDFVGDLRSRLFRYQSQAAQYFHLSRPAITRYENGVHRPPVGFLAGLVRLLVERQDELTANSYQRDLLSAANQAIRDHYQDYQDLSFKNWDELCSVADEYLIERRAKIQKNRPPSEAVSSLTAQGIQPSKAEPQGNVSVGFPQSGDTPMEQDQFDSFYSGEPVGREPLQVWQFNTGSKVASVAISADGETVIVGTLSKVVFCLDGKGIETWQTQVDNQAWRTAISRDGQAIVVGTGSTRPWDQQGRGLFCFANEGTLQWQVDLQASVWGLSLSVNSETIAVGTDSKQVLLFDGQGHRLWHQDVPGIGPYAWVWSAAISADGQRVVAGAADKRIRLLERSGKLLAEHLARGDVFMVSISANGEAMAGGDGAGYIYWLNRHGTLQWEDALKDKVWAVVLSQDGKRLLVGAGEKEAHVRTYDPNRQLIWRRHVRGSVSSVALSANGQRAAVGTREGGIYIFNETGEVLHQSRTNKPIRDVAISARGEQVIAGSEDGYVYGFRFTTPITSVQAASLPLPLLNDWNDNYPYPPTPI